MQDVFKLDKRSASICVGALGACGGYFVTITIMSIIRHIVFSRPPWEVVGASLRIVYLFQRVLGSAMLISAVIIYKKYLSKNNDDVTRKSLL